MSTKGTVMRFLVVAVLAAPILLGQVDERPITPPTWSEDQAVRLLGSSKPNVFFDPSDDSLVVLETVSGEKRATRIALHRRQAPTIGVLLEDLDSELPFQVLTTSSEPSPNSSLGMPSPVWEIAHGKYRYTYTLANSAAARDPIEVWSVVIPTGARVGVKKPAGWAGGGAFLPRGEAVATQAALQGLPNGRYVSWMAPDSGRGIRPGSTLGGFELLSDYKPGFCTATFSILAPIGEQINQDWPIEIKRELMFLDDPTWTHYVTVTFGPMFGQDSAREEIVRNFSAGIRHLVETGQLAAAAPFVKELTTALNQTENKDIVIHAALPRQIERQIAEAVSISLGFRFPDLFRNTQ